MWKSIQEWDMQNAVRKKSGIRSGYFDAIIYAVSIVNENTG